MPRVCFKNREGVAREKVFKGKAFNAAMGHLAHWPSGLSLAEGHGGVASLGQYRRGYRHGARVLP